MGTPAHSVTPRRGGRRRFAALAGVGAVVVAVAVAVPSLGADPTPEAETITTARSLTVEIAQATMPLTDAELLALVAVPAELGPLADPRRLASCLSGLGYPGGTAPVGGRSVTVSGRPAVILLLATDVPGVLTALAVSPQCSEVDTGLVADTTVRRP